MAALFACTKCHVRKPFEDLSQVEQLCKDCRNNFPIVKCTYCRAEFQQEEKGNINSICKKCAYNVKTHGKPKACSYCCIIAAFIGNKCQRCTYSERKCGPPSACEQCKQKCAFNQGGENRKKVDGKILCWLCTLAYKRVLARAFKKLDGSQEGMGSRKYNFDNLIKKNEKEKKCKIVEKRDSNSGSSNSQSSGSEKPDRVHITDKRDKPSDERSWSNRKSKSFQSLSSSQDESSPKKIRLEQSNSNGVTPTKRNRQYSPMDSNDILQMVKEKRFTNGTSLRDTRTQTNETTLKRGGLTISSLTTMEKNLLDPNTSDHLIAMTQLQEKLNAAKKQVTVKEQQLLEKEKKITELKAFQYEFEKEYRMKIQTIHKHHTSAIENLQMKNRELTKQVKTLSKGKKMATIICSNSASNSPLT